MGEQVHHRFQANNGRFVGWFTLAVAAIAVVLVLSDGVDSGDAVPVSLLALLAAFAWSGMLRPSIMHRGDDLVLRRAFSDVVIPLVKVDHVVIRMFMVVVTDDEKFISSAFSRPRRDLAKRDKGLKSVDPTNDYPDLIEHQINQLAENARAQSLPARETHRTFAWPEIAAVVGLAVLALVVTFVV